MKFDRRHLLPCVLIATLLSACGEVEDTRPGQPVKHRQEAFKSILRAFEPMGTMLKDKRYNPDKFLVMASELDAQKDAPWSYFGADTDYPPSKSKAEVWSKAAEFTKAKDDFKQAVEALRTAAATKDSGQIEGPYKQVYETCKGCHQTFRQK